jgi:hypothetical protein
MLSGMKQRDQFGALRIYRLQPIRLPTIAVKTGQRQIVERSSATLRQRHDVIHGKRHVLPLLGRMTILTQGLCTTTHLRLLGTWNRATTGHLARL